MNNRILVRKHGGSYQHPELAEKNMEAPRGNVSMEEEFAGHHAIG